MYDYKDKYININGNLIRYREAGTGPVLILVHGIAGFLEEWEPAMRNLSKHYRVITPDLLGHGLSDKPEIAYSLDYLTNFLKDFIHKFTDSRIFLAGHSLGGAICLNLAILFPGMVERLILINSIFIKIPLLIRLSSFKFLQKIKLKTPRIMVKISLKRNFFNKGFITTKWLDDAYRCINALGASRVMFSVINSSISLTGLRKDSLRNFLSEIGNLNIPVLIFYGKKDKILSCKNSLFLHELLKNSQSVAIDDCSHELQVEACDIFCAKTHEFLMNKFSTI
ncbi:MAG: alpha/beta hydrolase [Ruminiclostridium sp.]|nr:alpha/beta hydrolase [Ruminiclostridium sp.]